MDDWSSPESINEPIAFNFETELKDRVSSSPKKILRKSGASPIDSRKRVSFSGKHNEFYF